MNLSNSGLDKIAGYEGYHDALPDGSCKAYQRTYNGKKDKWTIGFGCTEGIYEGLIWTRAQADEAFRKELAKFEAAVNRLVTVELNQNQYDALVSFAYNCGTGALQSSTLLKKLNKGDYKGAANQFQFWNHVNGKPVNGLTQRRASEKNLFLKPVEPEPLPAMPQTVEKAREPVGEKTAATVGLGLTVAAQQTGAAVQRFANLDALEAAVNTGNRVRGVTQNGRELAFWALTLADWPFLLAAVVVGGGIYWFACYYLPGRKTS